MELKDFIRETLVQVAKGIEEAGSELQDSTAMVKPKNVQVDDSGNAKHFGYLHTEDSKHTFLDSVQAIEFDVSVHAQEGTEASAKGGISVGSIGFGAKGSSTETKSSESRIKFKVPMVLPQGK
ncbi:MAG: hypothetical protein GQ532_11950 [Methylomarinum sp.]|nr:hypothetical protein [Methylomarinum sp.]